MGNLVIANSTTAITPRPGDRIRIVIDDRQTGASSILDYKLIDDFADLIREGHPLDCICDYLGIDTSTFWFWKRKGEHYLNGGCTPRGYRMYGIFVRECRRAAAEYRMERVRRLHSRAKTWVRELAILERRDRATFSRREPPGGSLTSFNPDEKFV